MQLEKLIADMQKEKEPKIPKEMKVADKQKEMETKMQKEMETKMAEKQKEMETKMQKEMETKMAEKQKEMETKMQKEMETKMAEKQKEMEEKMQKEMEAKIQLLFEQRMMSMFQNAVPAAGYNGNEIDDQEAKHKDLQKRVNMLQGQSSTTTNNGNENK